MPTLLSEPAAWNLVAEGYARYTAEGLAQYSEEALHLADLAPGSAVLDVACGPGTLSFLAAKKARQVTAVDFSAGMVAAFQAELKKRGVSNIDVRQGDGQSLPLKSDSFDAAFSMFGLMFFPDRRKGFGELSRTLKRGGKAVVSSWAPIERSPLLHTLFGALRAMTPEAADPPRAPGALVDPEIFKSELEEAGFQNVRVVSVTKTMPAPSPAAFWQAMTAGSVPVVLLRKDMGEAVWAQKEKLAIAYLEKQWPAVSTRLSSDAWIGVGVKTSSCISL